MPTVIDSLVLELGLDPSKFTRGQRDALDALRKLQEGTEKGGKEVEAHGRKLGDFFQGLKRQVVELVATFAGARGITEIVRGTTQLGTSMGYAAQRLNMGVRELTAWNGALERMGAPADTATQSFEALNAAIQEATLTGRVPEGLPLLGRIGGFKDAAGQVKSLSQIFLELSDYIRRSGMSTAEATAFLMKIPGINRDMATFILKSRTEMEAWIKASGGAIQATDKLSAGATEFTNRSTLLAQRVRGSGNALMESLYPALNMVLGVMDKMIERFPILGLGFNFIGNAVASLGTVGSTILGTLLASRFGGPVLRGAGRLAMGGLRLGAGAAAGTVGAPLAIASAFLLGSTRSANPGEDERMARFWDQRDRDTADGSVIRWEDYLGRQRDFFDQRAGGLFRPGAASAARMNSVSSSSTDNRSTVSANIGNLYVNAPNARNPNDASAQGIEAALRRSVFVGSAESGQQ